MDGFANWITMVGKELGLDDAADTDRAMVLDVAREAARAAARPAATATVFLFGVAVGRGMPLAEAAHRIAGLAGRWGGGDCDWRD